MLRVSGTAGALRVGYQEAATLGAWEMEQLPTLPRAYRVSARLMSLSDYWIAQTPLDLVLEVGGEAWRWRDVTPVITPHFDRITLTLRQAPEIRPPAVAVGR